MTFNTSKCPNLHSSNTDWASHLIISVFIHIFDIFGAAGDGWLKTWTIVSLRTINIFHFMWFEVVSNERGIRLSAVSARCYRLALLFWPLQSLSLPLFHCCGCSRPCLQMSTRTEELFSTGATSTSTPPFLYTHTLSCSNASCIHNVRIVPWDNHREGEWSVLLWGVGWTSYPFQTWINVTDTCTDIHPSPNARGRRCVWMQGGGWRSTWDSMPVGSVCVLQSPVKKHQPSQTPESFFVLLSLQKPLPRPPPSLCALIVRQKAGVFALPHQVRRLFYLVLCSCFIALKMMEQKLGHQGAKSRFLPAYHPPFVCRDPLIIPDICCWHIKVTELMLW